MTCTPSATPEQTTARQQAFDSLPDPTTLVSREEIRAALLDRHTAATQDKLDAARVAICGLGGLGSTIAVALTRIGVGHLHLIDFDRVDMTNLNRQQYFLKDLGQYKTEALRANLKQINPFTDITIDTVKVTDENVPTLFEHEDIICEAFDVPENNTMLVNAVLESLPDKKLVSASGMAGDVLVVAYAKEQSFAQKMLAFAKAALQCYEQHYGPYAYPTLTLAEVNFPFGGVE